MVGVGVRAKRVAAAAIVTAACAMLAGCSSNKGSTPPPAGAADGGLDGSTPPVTDGSAPPTPDATGVVSPDSGTKQTSCIGEPFFTFAATVAVLDVSGATQPLAGAKIGFTSCPGFEITTDATGKASTQITQNRPLSPIYSGGASIIAGIGAEIPASADTAPAVTLFGFDVTSTIPGFEQDGGNAPTIAITLQADPAATAPCNDASGVTLAVSGHAEAVVSYANPGWPSNPSVTTTASTGPYVFVNGIVGASKVTLTGTKAGCSVKLATAAQTGTFLLVPGSVTVGVAAVTN
jgi:hypothetical protein